MCGTKLLKQNPVSNHPRAKYEWWTVKFPRHLFLLTLWSAHKLQRKLANKNFWTRIDKLYRLFLKKTFFQIRYPLPEKRWSSFTPPLKIFGNMISSNTFSPQMRKLQVFHQAWICSSSLFFWSFLAFFSSSIPEVFPLQRKKKSQIVPWRDSNRWSSDR